MKSGNPRTSAEGESYLRHLEGNIPNTQGHKESEGKGMNFEGKGIFNINLGFHLHGLTTGKLWGTFPSLPHLVADLNHCAECCGSGTVEGW